MAKSNITWRNWLFSIDEDGNDIPADRRTRETRSASEIQKDKDARDSSVSWTGAGLAIGAAIVIGATSVVTLPAAITYGAVALGGASAAKAGLAASDKLTEKNLAEDEEATAKSDLRKNIAGLIEKGKGKDGESRDRFFDKLEELYPTEAQAIRKARDASAPESEGSKDGSTSDTAAGGDESAETAAGSGAPREGEEVTTGSATLSGDAKE